MVRLTLLAASPVPYHVPLYAKVAADPEIRLTVIYASDGGVRPVQMGYKEPTSWDTDLMAGYDAVFLRNARRNPIEGSFFDLRDFDVLTLLRRLETDVFWIWGYNYLTHQLAIVSQLVRGRKVIYSEEQTLLDYRPVWKRALKWPLLRTLFSRGSALYIGTQNYRWFRHYGVRPERLFFTPYCVDNRRLRFARELNRTKRALLRAKFGIRAEGGPVILMVARLIPKKQPLQLIEAFRQVRRELQCSLLIVGTGVMEGAMREAVANASIPDVRFAGFLNQSQIADAYSCADVFVLSSGYRETWGLVVNEAMNFSLPIVVSDKVGCGIDLVKDNENGYTYPFDQTDALASRLAALVASSDRRASFGERSAAIVTGWNYDKAAEGVRQAVTRAVAGN